MKAEVVRFKELADDIVYNSRKVIRLGMFELHCDELVRALSKRADSLCAKILIKMSKTNMDLNKGLVLVEINNSFWILDLAASAQIYFRDRSEKTILNPHLWV